MRNRASQSASVRRQFLIAVIILAVFPVVVTACGTPVGDPIGAILQGLSNDLSNVIANAGAQAQATTMSAAGAVEEAVNNAESSFASDLSNSINQANDLERSTVENLQLLTHDVMTGTKALLNAATADAQQLINTLPFTNLNPQVTSYSPQILARTSPSSGPVEVRVKGNFFWAFQAKLIPTLKVQGTTYQPSLNETQQLGFELPASVFSSSPSSSFLPVSLELDAPYHQGHIFQSIQPGVFHLLVDVVPPSPFTSLTLVNQVTVSGTSTRTVIEPPGASSSSGGWYENSFDCNDKATTASYSADSGWTIIPSSAAVVYTWNKNPGGAPPPTILAQTTRVTIIVRTLAVCTCVIACFSNGSGDITFYLTYTEQQPSPPSTVPVTTQLQMNWGDQLVQNVTRGQWHLTANLFNGTHLEFSASDNSNPYLTIFDQGTSIRVSTPATDALNQ